MTTALLTSREAAAELRVSLATLYAYVSRGFIRAVNQPGSRQKLYHAIDVYALRDKQADLSLPRIGPEDGLVLETAISLISRDLLYYRGRNASELAKQLRLEALAVMLWDCADEDVFSNQAFEFAGRTVEGSLTLTHCMREMLGYSLLDARAYDRSRKGVARTGARILRAVVTAFVGGSFSDEVVHARLARAWNVSDKADVIRAALVLCADHELSTSTLAVRVTASSGAPPWSAVLAGLSCLQGPRHAGSLEAIYHLLDEVTNNGSAEAVLTARLRRGESIPGFGGLLYTGDDPRASLILKMLARCGNNRFTEISEQIADLVRKLTGTRPDLFYSLACLARQFGIDDRAALAILITGRTVGWIAHIMEQYASSAPIRPRARYVGIVPV